MPDKTIAVISTLDTKDEEAFFIRDIIRERGLRPILVDVGPLTAPDIKTDFANSEIAQLAGWKLSDLSLYFIL